MFGLSRLVIPHLKQTPLPEKLPRDLQQIIQDLKKKHPTKEAFLKAAYGVVTTRFTGTMTGQFRHPRITLSKDINKIWNTPGIQPCTTQNFVLRTMLIKSGLFKKSEIRNFHAIVRANIHQIIGIKINNKWVYTDPWAKYYNTPLGEYYGWRFTKVTETIKKIFNRAK